MFGLTMENTKENTNIIKISNKLIYFKLCHLYIKELKKVKQV